MFEYDKLNYLHKLIQKETNQRDDVYLRNYSLGPLTQLAHQVAVWNWFLFWWHQLHTVNTATTITTTSSFCVCPSSTTGVLSRPCKNRQYNVPQLERVRRASIWQWTEQNWITKVHRKWPCMWRKWYCFIGNWWLNKVLKFYTRIKCQK